MANKSRTYCKWNNKRRRRIRKAVWDKTGGLCWLCGMPTNLDEDVSLPRESRMTIDHVISRADGGSDDLSNLMPAHYLCNFNRGQDKSVSAVPLPKEST